MKRIAMMCMAALLMSGMAMAQGRHGDRGPRMDDPKARAEMMTERMAKEYSLNDEQKAKLLELNLSMEEKMSEMRPMGRPDGPRPEMRPEDCPKDSCICQDCGCKKNCVKPEKRQRGEGRRPELTDEQRQQMETARADYNAQLQQIMTTEQYEAYTKNMKDRKPGMPPRR